MDKGVRVERRRRGTGRRWNDNERAWRTGMKYRCAHGTQVTRPQGPGPRRGAVRGGRLERFRRRIEGRADVIMRHGSYGQREV